MLLTLNIESEILLTTAEDFNFIHDSTHLYWVEIKNLSEKGKELNLNTMAMMLHLETKLPHRPLQKMVTFSH